MTTALIDTGCANIASVGFALARLGAPYRVCTDPDQARDCQRLILPGVGAAASAMRQLERRGWAEILPSDDRDVLGICLGMQLLFDHSDEGDVTGLGLLPGRVRKLPRENGQIWPHMGWNTLNHLDDSDPLLAGIAESSHVYFVHGYFVPEGAATVAVTSYGTKVTAVARQGRVAGCQFHPERSGATGARILANFLESKP
jgi:glutamine amidotransferase